MSKKRNLRSVISKRIRIFSQQDRERSKEILSINPTILPVRKDVQDIKIEMFDFSSDSVAEKHFHNIDDCLNYKFAGTTTWININGLNKNVVDKVCNHFDVHPLIAEDILSIKQRPKMDEAEGYIYSLLNMIYLDEKELEVETEQISILLCKNVVISFQEDAIRDVFNSLRERLRISNSKLRQRTADFLCYSLLDMIVDNYFVVMEKLGLQIEDTEEELMSNADSQNIVSINHLRKEFIVLKRNITPVRELVNGFIRSDSDLLEDRHTKYFKDVYDHAIQAGDLLENYRDVISNLLDLHFNNVNIRLNEVMKVVAIVTCLMAPATIISGVFGMNFEFIPWLHNPFGFWSALVLMLFIPVVMIIIFRKRGWI